MAAQTYSAMAYCSSHSPWSSGMGQRQLSHSAASHESAPIRTPRVSTDPIRVPATEPRKAFVGSRLLLSCRDLSDTARSPSGARPESPTKIGDPGSSPGPLFGERSSIGRAPISHLRKYLLTLSYGQTRASCPGFSLFGRSEEPVEPSSSSLASKRRPPQLRRSRPARAAALRRSSWQRDPGVL